MLLIEYRSLEAHKNDPVGEPKPKKILMAHTPESSPLLNMSMAKAWITFAGAYESDMLKLVEKLAHL